MSDYNYNQYVSLELTPWDTYDEGSLRERAFPHKVVADYSGHPEEIRFGAFVGWIENWKWWVDLARRLSLQSFRQFELLDIGHQAGGHHCVPMACNGLPVSIAPSYIPFFEALCRDYFYAHQGYLDPMARDYEGDLREYRLRIGAAGLTSGFSTAIHGIFMEGVYPLDGTDDNLQAVLARPADDLSRIAPLVTDEVARDRLRIVVLADNSD